VVGTSVAEEGLGQDQEVPAVVLDQDQSDDEAEAEVEAPVDVDEAEVGAQGVFSEVRGGIGAEVEARRGNAALVNLGGPNGPLHATETDDEKRRRKRTRTEIETSKRRRSRKTGIVRLRINRGRMA